MSELLIMLAVLGVSFIIGYLLISKVPPLLHTPLMSMTNAISAVTVLGGLLLFAAEQDTAGVVIGVVALAMASFNIMGGFAITDRMVKMFKSENKK